MPCSSSSSSSSSTNYDDDPDYRVDASDDEPDYRAATPDDGNAATDVVLPTHADPERVVSLLCTQDDVDAVCEKYSVPKGQYTARPAGDHLRASSHAPPGAVCVYAHALEAGMRVPLHPFYRDALAHLGVAPTQLAPNAWRIMAGFLVLCHSAGVPPSLAVFRHFFGFLPLLPANDDKRKRWYFFRSRDTSGLCLAGLPQKNKDWKKGFFFLSSPEPWGCPVEWGVPPESSFVEPALSGEEEEMAARLLQAHDAAPVDLRTYLCDSNLVAAKISPASPAPSSCARTSAGSKGMDPSVYGMMKTMLAEKAAAAAVQASAKKVKTEPRSLCGKKWSLDNEADAETGPPPSSVLPNASPDAHGCSSAPTGVCSPPPGFPRTPQHFATAHADGESTDWKAARELLRGAIAPAQERVFAASRPSDVLASCGVAVLKGANYTSFSLGYALELEKKLAARDAEVAALQDQLNKAKAKLAAVKGPLL
uniref:Uncharacterized protein n=1 Tax=Avena sativa TaxID=4498 RepID=A0ACD6AE61_AVESA